STVATPGPMIVPPWVVVSLTLAAGGIEVAPSHSLSQSVELDEAALDLGHRRARDLDAGRAFYLELGATLGAERSPRLDLDLGPRLELERVGGLDLDPRIRHLDLVAVLVRDLHRLVVLAERDLVPGRRLEEQDLLVVVEVDAHLRAALINLLVVVIRAGE